MEKGKSALVGLLVLGLAIGGGAGYAIGNSGSDDKTSTSTSSQSESANTETDGVTVGGAKMVRSLDIVDNALNAKNVTTVVAAVKAAGLVDALKAPGPLTVFAPNNGAFEALPAGTVDNLLKPENKNTLTGILTYHVVSGTYTSADLRAMATAGTTLTSLQGGVLTPVLVDGQVQIKDAKGSSVAIETPDVISSNGVTHVITSVLMPN